MVRVGDPLNEHTGPVSRRVYTVKSRTLLSAGPRFLRQWIILCEKIPADLFSVYRWDLRFVPKRLLGVFAVLPLQH